MSRSRLFIAALTATTALTVVPAFAQDAAAGDDVTEVVVTGTRAQPRSRLDTLAPVDIVRKDALDAQGSTELAQTLSRVAPSLNFPRPAGVDGTDNIRPASLRGLAPDQTLVLVNGKRRHTSALVNINGSAGRGSVAVDLNAIPTAGLSTVEILRDGASAQYGSDAIAGVVNLRLREARQGGEITATVGSYLTDVKAANSSRKEEDGQTYAVSGWVGLPLGSDGFLTLSGEARKRRPTSRGDIDTDPTVTRPLVTGRYGDPEQESVSVFANAGKPLANGWELYGNAGYTHNDSTSAAFFRHYNSSNNVLSIYPNGFLPLINTVTDDYSATVGIKGQWGEWTSDYSLAYGSNQIDFYTRNSINRTYGVNSKTSFYDGQLKYDQLVFNADISRPFDVAGLYSPLTLALGFEARQENYKITAGELQSYGTGPEAGGPAAQGFGGFLPANAVDQNRNNVGVYVDVSADITERLSFDFAARAENYSDFGDDLSGKLALRYEFTDSFAVRGSASTGFRAPSLAQQYFSSTASNLVTVGGVTSAVQAGTFPATSFTARTLGATDLKAEKSTNYALGFVFNKGPFNVTLDGYSIRITDRIVLSENISSSTTSGYYSAPLKALLDASGVSSARFFLNGVTTETTGVDLVAAYRLNTDALGTYNISFAYNNSNTSIKKFPSINVLSSLSPAPPLFARQRQYLLAASAPENKASLGVDWKLGSWSANGRATYYDDVVAASGVAANDVHTGKKTLVDLSASYRFGTGTTVTLGADNLFDVYPDKTPANLNILSGNGAGATAFTFLSPFGFNGRYVYARLSHSF